MAGPMDFLRNNSQGLLQAGIGLIGGKTGSEQAAMGLQGFAQGRQQNKTMQFLQQTDPELAQAVQAGALTAGDAFKLSYQRKLEAQAPMKPLEVNGRLVDPRTFQVVADFSDGPKAPDIKELYDEKTGMPYKAQWNPQTRTFDRVGGTKGASGFEVTLPDGTSVRQGAFGNQDQKNVANRVTEAQDMAATGTSLKQTAAMLREANKNVGYSGVGGEVVGGVLDTAEQFGVPIAGNAGARAQMRSGGLDVALAQVQKTKGAISNAEMQLFMAAAPGLKNTPQGNAALIEIIDKVADRQILRVDEMEKWRQQYGTLDGFEASWADFLAQNPIITQTTLGGGTGAGAGTRQTSSGVTWSAEP